MLEHVARHASKDMVDAASDQDESEDELSSIASFSDDEADGMEL